MSKRKSNAGAQAITIALEHHRSGRLQEAERQYRDILQVDPNQPDVLHALGVLALQSGHGQDAVALIEKAIHNKLKTPDAYSNLGNALMSSQRPEEALANYKIALRLSPRHFDTHNNLANALRIMGRFEQAVESYKTALSIHPEFAVGHYYLAQVYMSLGHIDAAIDQYNQTLNINPQFAEAYNSMGVAYQYMGRMDLARDCYAHALRLIPSYAEAIYNLAIVTKHSAQDGVIAKIEMLLKQPNLRADDAVNLHYAAAKALADGGHDHDRAFYHYQEGARLKRRSYVYDVHAIETFFTSVATAFSADQLVADSGGYTAKGAVFIVGMARSGTTLVEQILSSHSKIHGAGERMDIQKLVSQADERFDCAFPNWAVNLSQRDREIAGRAYFDAVVAPIKNAACVLDKMPGNFPYIGLISQILPEARFIHVTRSAMDTCVSCLTTLFSTGHEFSYDLEELGTFYRAYDAMMSHWQRSLPAGKMIEIAYENLITAPEPEIRKVLDHCGLPWESECLNFHHSQRPVRTASNTQVRQPMYKTSIGRWEVYREHLSPLLQALE